MRCCINPNRKKSTGEKSWLLRRPQRQHSSSTPLITKSDVQGSSYLVTEVDGPSSCWKNILDHRFRYPQLPTQTSWTTSTHQPYAFNIFTWRPRLSRNLPFLTLPLFLNWLNQRPIAFPIRNPLRYVRRQLRCIVWNRRAFGETNDALCFLAHTRHRPDCGSGSAYYSRRRIAHAHEVRAQIRSRACFTKLYESMNRLRQIPSLYFSSLESQYVSKTGPPFSISLYAESGGKWRTCGTTKSRRRKSGYHCIKIRSIYHIFQYIKIILTLITIVTTHCICNRL